MEHYRFRSVIYLSILYSIQLFGHGFSADMLISRSIKSVELQSIKIVCEDALETTEKVVSFDFAKNKYIYHRIQSAATAQSNCYVCIRFNNESWDDVICTPEQEFYISATKQWVPAYQLRLGDQLFSQDKSLAQITHIQFYSQQIIVYAVRVKKVHNFFVGRHRVLTHNILLPIITMSIGAAFGSGATAGAAAGSFLGPITIGAGIVLGGCIGMLAKTMLSIDQLPQYELSCDVNNFNFNHAQQNQDSEKKKEQEEQISGACGGGGSPDPGDPNDPFNWWKKKKPERIFISNSYPNGRYEDVPYHTKKGNSRKSSKPIDGQKALDNSLSLSARSGRRISISEGQFVVLDKTSSGVYHGHVRTWDQLDPTMKSIFRKANLVKPNGKIIL